MKFARNGVTLQHPVSLSQHHPLLKQTHLVNPFRIAQLSSGATLAAIPSATSPNLGAHSNSDPVSPTCPPLSRNALSLPHPLCCTRVQTTLLFLSPPSPLSPPSSGIFTLYTCTSSSHVLHRCSANLTACSHASATSYVPSSACAKLTAIALFPHSAASMAAPMVPLLRAKTAVVFLPWLGPERTRSMGVAVSLPACCWLFRPSWMQEAGVPLTRVQAVVLRGSGDSEDEGPAGWGRRSGLRRGSKAVVVWMSVMMWALPIHERWVLGRMTETWWPWDSSADTRGWT